MTFFAKSDIGLVRTSNQDNYICCEFNENCGFAVVCDGMGGHNGGNVASELAISTIKANLVSLFDGQAGSSEIPGMINLAVQKANDKIYNVAEKDENLKGMGTTMVLSFIFDGRAYLAHAGDSRAYFMRGGVLTRLTKDHSFVQEMIEKGQITVEQAQTHPYKNVITRALGSVDYVEIDCMSMAISEGDYILLCSDGLSNLVSDNEMEEILNSEEDEKICDKLVDSAKQNGGPDNITVVVMKT